MDKTETSIDLTSVGSDLLIRELSSRCKWTKTGDRYIKIFGVSNESAAWYYGQIACIAYVRVRSWEDAGKILYCAMLVFPSIDDSYVSLIGPWEDHEKAARRASLLKDETEDYTFVPNMDTFKVISTKTGTYVDLN